MKCVLRIVVLALVGCTVLSNAVAQEALAQEAEESKPKLSTGGGKVYSGVSPIEVRFPNAMVAAELLGKEEGAPAPIVFTPALQGTFVWRSLRSGTFTLSELPPMAMRFVVSTLPGLLDADGEVVPESTIGSFETAAADVVDQYPRYFASHELPRQLQVTYFFNAEIALESA
ncbi:MAG: hypothetical protein O3C21_16235, partial [Verrucomicrobia bacterium]|nr:hypothetical protein [Verrucomicrobiota bacterium]